MKAPSDGDRPASVAISAVPVTSSSETAVNTSGVFVPPMARNNGRSRKRPPIRMTATANGGASNVMPRNVIRQAVVGQQRDDRDERNEGEVLEQQHGEGVAAGGRGEQVTLGQHRQDDGGGGHGQARAQHGGALPRRCLRSRSPARRALRR